MKYTTTKTEQKKVQKETKFDIGDIVRFESETEIADFKVLSIKIHPDRNEVCYYGDSCSVLEDDLTLVSKNNNNEN